MALLTKREWAVLTFIQQYICSHGHAPSTTEMAHSLGKVAGGGIIHTLRSLEGKGVIHRGTPGRRGCKRAISIVRGVKVGVEP